VPDPDRPAGGYAELTDPPVWLPTPPPTMAPGEWHTLVMVGADVRIDLGPRQACPLFHPPLALQCWCARSSGRLFFRAKTLDPADDFWAWIGSWLPATPARPRRRGGRRPC